MASFTEIQDAIYAVILDKTGVESVWANQNAPKRSNPYFSLLMTAFNKIGWDVTTLPDENDNTSNIGNREITLQISE